MQKFEILEIIVELAYEKFIIVKNIKNNKIFQLYFIDFNEFGNNSLKRNIGDILEGELHINLVNKISKTESQLYYKQLKRNVSIEAVIEIIEIIDEYSFYGFSNIQEEKILVEVEFKINFKIGDKVLINGGLEIELREYS